MKNGFTLAEVLITLAIIGVVAALTIPSVIVNTQQHEFKTGLKKAVSVLNSSITMNKALEGESPYDNSDLFNYLQQHMSVLKSTVGYIQSSGSYNKAFYTTDGMRFEVPRTAAGSRTYNLKLHESDAYATNGTIKVYNEDDLSTTEYGSKGCGSYGMSHNPNETMETPCFVLVDVNGDRKPNMYADNATAGAYSYPSVGDKKINDLFNILITDEKAIPYGVVAQKAMYNNK